MGFTFLFEYNVVVIWTQSLHIHEIRSRDYIAVHQVRDHSRQQWEAPGNAVEVRRLVQEMMMLQTCDDE